MSGPGAPSIGGAVSRGAGGRPSVGGQLAGAAQSGDLGEVAYEAGAVGAEIAVNAAVSSFASPVVGKVAGAATGKVVRSKAGRYLLAAVAVFSVLSVLANWFLIASATMTVVSAFSSFTNLGAAAEEAQSKCYGTPTLPGVDGGVVGNLTLEQLGNAEAIIQALALQNALPADVIIAVMVAMTESSLINVEYGDKAGPDSRGLFQQRDSWGTLAERMDPATATGLFYSRLLNVQGRMLLSPWQAGQNVQISAFPDGSNYHKNYARAVEIVRGYFSPVLMQSAKSDQWLNWVPGTTLPPPPTGDTTAPDWMTTYCGNTGGVTNGGSAGPWGGHKNGEIPAAALCPITYDVDEMLRCDATISLDAMNAAYTAALGGPILITDSYRTLARQVQLKAEKGGMAATPGYSNHGWGLALDLDLTPGPENFTSPGYQWMAANAPSFGWINPDWAKPGPKWTKDEPWHWEFVGVIAPEQGVS